MYALAWETPDGSMVVYGPFETSDEAHRWFLPKLAFINPDEHRVIGYAVLSPFEHTDAVQSDSVGSCYHAGRESDDRADAFVVTVVVTESISFGVGPFPSRDSAWQWFMSQRMKLHGAQGLVLPMLTPDNETVSRSGSG